MYIPCFFQTEKKVYRLIFTSDHFGVSTLEYAVRSGSIEIVHEFIDRCDALHEKLQVIKHALLFSIKEDNYEMVDNLLSTDSQIR